MYFRCLCSRSLSNQRRLLFDIGLPESFLVGKLIRICFAGIDRMIFSASLWPLSSIMSRTLKRSQRSVFGSLVFWLKDLRSNGKTVPLILFFLKYCFIRSSSDCLMSEAWYVISLDARARGLRPQARSRIEEGCREEILFLSLG